MRTDVLVQRPQTETDHCAYRPCSSYLVLSKDHFRQDLAGLLESAGRDTTGRS